jgi:hypothetical protein
MLQLQSCSSDGPGTEGALIRAAGALAPGSDGAGVRVGKALVPSTEGAALVPATEGKALVPATEGAGASIAKARTDCCGLTRERRGSGDEGSLADHAGKVATEGFANPRRMEFQPGLEDNPLLVAHAPRDSARFTSVRCRALAFEHGP